MNKSSLLFPLLILTLCSCNNNDVTDITSPINSSTTTTIEEEILTQTISSVRKENDGTIVTMKGVVWKILYAYGNKPCGFYLVDDTDSIYVYGNIANNLSEGNEVIIKGTKTKYILEKEKENAKKFGYEGAIQIANASLLKVTNQSKEVNKSWINKSTIKDMLETPLTNNITSTVFKVNGIIKESNDGNYTNYYIDDLDEKTGSYVYTQCNGDDFTYLKKYEGKVCTIFLSIINAASRDTGVIYRFIPLEIIDENYVFDAKNEATKFVLDYYINDQFKESYTSSPDLELITSVSSSLLGFDNVTISYSSTNTNVAYFEEIDNKTYFKLNENGESTIKATAKYLDKEETALINIKKIKEVVYDTFSINEVINGQDGTEFITKGIVSSSLSGSKQSSFYLFDDTGSIVVTLLDQTVKGLVNIGDEVVIQGTKQHSMSNKKYIGTYPGQIELSNSKLLTNKYGKHEIPTNIIKDTSFNDLYTICNDGQSDHSQDVYKLKAKILKTSSMYPTYNMYENDENTIIQFYSSNVAQYTDYFDKYLNQELTYVVAPVNWNKKFYKLNLIYIILDSGEIINYKYSL